MTAPTKPLVHQLWNGDSRELGQRFKQGRIDCIITDPPFGIDNVSKSAVTPEGKAHVRKIANDKSVEEALKTFNEVMDVLLPKMAEHSDMYVFTSGAVLGPWLMDTDSLTRHGFQRSGILVWEKDGPGMGDVHSRMWGQGIEYILYFKKGRRNGSDVRRNGVIHIPQLRPNQLIHPHEKPTALLELFVKHSTNRGDFIVDPFAGSGSTIRAARNLGRSAVGIESDPKNFAIAKRALDEGSAEFDL
jgi:adenine-specific DNA-methyltransferase